jgi:hypothetical protein
MWPRVEPADLATVSAQGGYASTAAPAQQQPPEFVPGAAQFAEGSAHQGYAEGGGAQPEFVPGGGYADSGAQQGLRQGGGYAEGGGYAVDQAQAQAQVRPPVARRRGLGVRLCGEPPWRAAPEPRARRRRRVSTRAYSRSASSSWRCPLPSSPCPDPDPGPDPLPKGDGSDPRVPGGRRASAGTG